MSIIRDMIDCGTWRERKPSAHRLWLKNRPAIDGESIEGGWGRARGLLGGAFMGTILAQQGGKPTARDYVQDGLVFNLDGIENDGYGRHYSGLRSTNIDLTGNISVVDQFSSYKTELFADYYSFIFENNMSISPSLFLSGITFEVCYAQGASVGELNMIARLSNILSLQNQNNLWGYGKCYDVSIPILQPAGRPPQSVRSHYVTRASGPGDGLLAFTDMTKSVSYNYTGGQIPSSVSLSLHSGSTNNRINIHFMRCYSRWLTDTELSLNHKIDQARFGLP